MDSEVLFVPVFTLIVVIVAGGIGLIVGRRRRAKIAKRAAADTTAQQAADLLNKLIPNGASSYTAVPAAVGLTAGQSAKEYGKEFAKGMALSLVTGRSVHVHGDHSADDCYILAYGHSDFYLIPIRKQYSDMQIFAEVDRAPFCFSADNIEKFKYNSMTATATVVLKDKADKFSVTPRLAFFDKANQERMDACKEFLKRFAEEFGN